MISREDVIITLSKKLDPRSISWEFRAILDVLQDEEPITVKELESAICKKYDCELFTYKQLYDIIQTLVKQNVIKNNPVTKQYCIAPEYRTKEVRYLPISTYSLVLLLLSVGNLIMTIPQKEDPTIALIMVLIGALYLLAQYIGAEFNPENGLKQFVPKLFTNQKRMVKDLPTGKELPNGKI
jgi:predicted transcriptional regulator